MPSHGLGTLVRDHVAYRRTRRDARRSVVRRSRRTAHLRVPLRGDGSLGVEAGRLRSCAPAGVLADDNRCSVDSRAKPSTRSIFRKNRRSALGPQVAERAADATGRDRSGADGTHGTRHGVLSRAVARPSPVDSHLDTRAGRGTDPEEGDAARQGARSDPGGKHWTRTAAPSAAPRVEPHDERRDDAAELGTERFARSREPVGLRGPTSDAVPSGHRQGRHVCCSTSRAAV